MENVKLYPQTSPAPLVRAFGIPELDLDQQTLDKLEDYHKVSAIEFKGYGHPGTRFANGIFILKRPANSQSKEIFYYEDGQWEQITHLSELNQGNNISRWFPLKSGVYFSMDYGGNEKSQLHKLHYDSLKIERLTNDSYIYHLSLEIYEQHIVYSTNKRNNVDFDCYLLNVETGKEIMIYQATGVFFAMLSPDFSKVLLCRNISRLETVLLVGDFNFETVQDADLHSISDQIGTSNIDSAVWKPNSNNILYFSTTKYSEFATVVEYNVATKAVKHITTPSGPHPVDWDTKLKPFNDGVLLVVNEGGNSVLFHYADEKLAKLELSSIGVVKGEYINMENTKLMVELDNIHSPSTLYEFDANFSGKEFMKAKANFVVAEPEKVSFKSFDGLQIPAFYYKANREKSPVVLYMHGGPASQLKATFCPPNHCLSFQYLVNEMGISVLAPNVRGSSGYGATYQAADDGMKRMDSVYDIGACIKWIKSQPNLDGNKICIMGRSYGGYMVLAGLIEYPELHCGIDTCGISDFVSFMNSMPEFRRDLRRPEYGDERVPEMYEFLKRISPLTNASKIKVPLLIGQGENDIRVALGEAVQIANSVEGSWLMVAEKEGHIFFQKSVLDYYRKCITLFLMKYLQ
ncbi:Dipeptidyl aminopeptidase [Terramyces sp. JEL0728]|nr:Dipeptidyl aminopeptidase [Terramyces sp. JEL0728]